MQVVCTANIVSMTKLFQVDHSNMYCYTIVFTSLMFIVIVYLLCTVVCIL